MSTCNRLNRFAPSKSLGGQYCNVIFPSEKHSDWFLNLKRRAGYQLVLTWLPIKHPQMTSFSSSTVMVTWLFLSRILQLKAKVPIRKGWFSPENFPLRTPWQIWLTQCRGFWAMPHAAVATSVTSLSSTPWRHFVESAAIIGCGRNTTFKLLIFWRFRSRGPELNK